MRYRICRRGSSTENFVLCLVVQTLLLRLSLIGYVCLKCGRIRLRLTRTWGEITPPRLRRLSPDDSPRTEELNHPTSDHHRDCCTLDVLYSLYGPPQSSNSKTHSA